jgi:two-component system, cell cycle sensor histidine kinase and response regulator CckA
MTKQRHSLLKRQLKRCFGEAYVIPAEWAAFVQTVQEAYVGFDVDRAMLERSLELSSQELLQANSEMRAVFQAIPDLLFHLDAEGTILSCKAGTTSSLVLEPRELRGKRIQDVPDKAVGEKFQAAILAVLHENKPASIEYSLETQGQMQFYETRLMPLPQYEMVAIIRNITERKRVEAALRESEERHRQIARCVPDMIWVMDLSGRFTYANSATRRITGWTVEELLKLHFQDAVTPQTATKYAKAIEEELARVSRPHYDRNWVRTFESEHLHKNGSTFWAEIAGTFTWSADGKPIGVIGTTRDVTDRRRAEEELFNSRQMLQTVLDTIPQRVFWKDRNSIYVGCNKSHAQDSGYADPGQLIGKTDFETKWAENAETYRDDDRSVMETGQPKNNFEEPISKADGTKTWMRTSKVPLFDKDGNVTGVLGTYEDITERKRLEEQFRQSQKMEAFGQLAAGVAHDFNNILTVILGNLSLLGMGGTSKVEETSAIEEAGTAAKRAANLTRQLLTFSRRQPLQLRDLDLNEVVANLTKMLHRLIGEHISLEARYAPGGAPIFADVSMMEQVLVNLAVNSRDAMPKGGRLVIELASEVVDEKMASLAPNRNAGEFIRLDFSDTGIGIPAENMAHIFEPFFTTKEVGKGSGLGLATVFSIVQQHNGWIELESAPGKGTTFHIHLPRQLKTKTTPVKTTGRQPVPGGNETILLVEDEPSVRQLARRLLTRQGYKIHEADSGPAALEIWSKHRKEIDLLITDMVMPKGINGRELADRLLKDRKNLKVIYCSGYTDEMLGEDTPLRNNPNFLEKPFDPQTFLQHVRSCLDAP